MSDVIINPETREITILAEDKTVNVIAENKTIEIANRLTINQVQQAYWGEIEGNINDQEDLALLLDNKPDLGDISDVGFSGDYGDLLNKPSIPSKTSDLSNDSGFLIAETDPIFSAWDKDYNDLINTPFIPSQLSDLSDDSTHRLITDLEKTGWNNKQESLGFTPENVANKATNLNNPDNTTYPTTSAISTALSLINEALTTINNALIGKQDNLGFTPENLANKSATLTDPDNIKYPSTLAVASALETKQGTLISGTNIKTINGVSILGSGDLLISGSGLISGTISPNQVAFGSGIAILTGSDNLTYANGQFTSIGTGDGTLYEAYSTTPTTANYINWGGNFVAGFTFVPADFITVSQLGRKYNGNTNDYPIGIWRRDTGALITSATILASSSSDANGVKWVSITPVQLSPSIEYIIASNVINGDIAKHLWDSTGFFSPFIKRTGLALVASATLTIPTSLGSGTNIYNTCTFKFTTQANIQVRAGYNSTNFLGMLSRSDGTATLLTQNNDQPLTFFNNVYIGSGLPTGYNFAVNGSGFIRDFIVSNGVSGDTLRFGSNINANTLNAVVHSRSGFLMLDGGVNGVLFNYDNSSKNVGIAVIPTAKLDIVNTTPTQPCLKLQLASNQSSNAWELRNSTNNILTNFSSNGAFQPVSLSDTNAPNNSIYYSSTQTKLCYKDSSGNVNLLY